MSDFNFKSFDPPTIDTFGAHYRQRVYHELGKAIDELRWGQHVRCYYHLGRAEVAESVLYDIQHPLAHLASRAVRRVRRIAQHICKRQPDLQNWYDCGTPPGEKRKGNNDA